MTKTIREKRNYVAGAKVKGTEIIEFPWRGTYIPERSLSRWRQWKAPTIGWFGDSTVNGDVGAFDLTNGGYGSGPEILSLILQSFGPYVGPGFYGTWRDEWAFAGSTNLFTSATTSDAWDVGPYLSAKRSAGNSGTLATFTIPPTVDPVNADLLFWDDTAAASAQWSFATSLDGTTFTAYANATMHWTTGNPVVSRQRISIPSGTTHIRVKAANTSNVAKQVTLLGVVLYVAAPATAIGPQIHNLGNSANFISTAIRSTAGSALRTVWHLNLTLAIIGPYTNDSASGTTYQDDVRALIKGLKVRVVYDVTTTNTSTTITSPTANFDKSDYGKSVFGTGLGAGLNYIDSVTNATTAVLKNAATVTSSGANVKMWIAPNRVKIGTDGITTNGSRVFDAATGNFTQGDVGRLIVGSSIPSFTTISKVNSGTQVVLSGSVVTGASSIAYTVSEATTFAAWDNALRRNDPDILLIGQFHQSPETALTGLAVTNGNAIITGPAGTFQANHVNRTLSGTGFGGVILSVQGDTQVTVNANTSRATGSGLAGTLSGRITADEDDLRAGMKSVARAVITNDGTAVDGDNTYTSATAAFTSDDVGKAVTGWGIQPDSYIQAVNSATSVELSRPAIGDGTGYFEMIGYAFIDMGEVWYSGNENWDAGLLYNQLHESQKGHSELANAVANVLNRYS